MEIVYAIVIGVLFGASVYLLLRRSIVKLIIGLALLAHAANLLIFTVGGFVRGAPPLIEEGEKALSGAYADPVPQALILTAIVIGFGAQAFAIVLVKKVYDSVGTDDIEAIRTTDIS